MANMALITVLNGSLLAITALKCFIYRVINAITAKWAIMSNNGLFSDPEIAMGILRRKCHFYRYLAIIGPLLG